MCHWLVRLVAHSLFRQCCSLVIVVEGAVDAAAAVGIVAVMLVDSQRQVRDGVVAVVVLGGMTLELLKTP